MTPKVVAFDFETFLIEPGVQAPRPVCMSYADADGVDIVSAADCWVLLSAWLDDPNVWLVGANVQFDLLVAAVWGPVDLLPKIFAAYDSGRVFDVQVRDKLLMLEQGRLGFDVVAQKAPSFSLSALAARWLGRVLEKGGDTWRLRYSELVDVPVWEYPDEALSYALLDAKTTLDVWNAQNYNNPAPWTNEKEQHAADFCLGLLSLVGLSVDVEAARTLADSLRAEVEALDRDLIAANILRRDGTRDLGALRARVRAGYASQGQEPPQTDKGATSTSSETLLFSGDPLLVRIGELSSSQKLLTSFLPNLEVGIVNPRYDVLKESGRTSSFKPNIQQMPRTGGIRELFRPPEGFVFLDADYSTLELCALAQVNLDLFRFSDMADRINEGADLHLVTAAQILGMTYQQAVSAYPDDKEVAETRQISKAANFGFPGGMGASAFVEFARGYGLDLAPDFVLELRSNWLRTYREMRRYFDHIGQLSGGRDSFDVVQIRSHRIRGGCRYTSGCNTLFQGLASDGAKEALGLLARACYSDRASPLFGCFIHAFVHDEFLLSCPEDRIADAGEALERLMIAGMRRWIPDVAIRVDVTAARKWTKKAKRVTDNSGRLRLWG